MINIPEGVPEGHLSAKAKSVLYALRNGGSGCDLEELLLMVNIPAIDERAMQRACYQLWLQNRVERRWLMDGGWHYFLPGQSPNTSLGYVIDD